MPRKRRVHFSGAIYHVMLRGNHGKNIFRSDRDRKYFLTLIAEGKEEYDHSIHAYCLMDNHVHFAIQVFDVPLGKIIQNFAFRYAQWMNKQESQKGHLFQGRYKSKLVEDNDYLLTLIRYIHLNPLRANLVKHVDDYPWSSHLSYIGRLNHPWLAKKEALSCFSEDPSKAIESYRIFLKEVPEETLPPTLPINRLTVSLIIKTVTKYFSVSAESLSTPSRSESVLLARSYIGLIIKEFNVESINYIASLFKRDPSSIGQSIKKLKNMPETKTQLKEIFSLF